MSPRVCPWWIGYLLANPVRRLFQNPARLLAPYIGEDMTVLEPGPGMGFFTLELARMVGPGGRVIAVDIQPKMLSGLERRARRAGLQDRIELRLATPSSLDVKHLAGCVDVVCAFAVVHEVPDAAAFFAEAAEALKPGSALLLVEPVWHVNAAAFENELARAAATGFTVMDRPSVWRSRAAALRRS